MYFIDDFDTIRRSKYSMLNITIEILSNVIMIALFFSDRLGKVSMEKEINDRKIKVCIK